MTVVLMWDWLKKYWKWIVFPVGLFGLIVSYFVGRNANQEFQFEIVGGGSEVVEKLVSAQRARDDKLIELAEVHKERIKNLSEDQEEELSGLSEKPIEEVVAWFNKF